MGPVEKGSMPVVYCSAGMHNKIEEHRKKDMLPRPFSTCPMSSICCNLLVWVQILNRTNVEIKGPHSPFSPALPSPHHRLVCVRVDVVNCGSLHRKLHLLFQYPLFSFPFSLDDFSSLSHFHHSFMQLDSDTTKHTFAGRPLLFFISLSLLDTD